MLYSLRPEKISIRFQTKWSGSTTRSLKAAARSCGLQYASYST